MVLLKWQILVYEKIKINKDKDKDTIEFSDIENRYNQENNYFQSKSCDIVQYLMEQYLKLLYFWLFSN